MNEPIESASSKEKLALDIIRTDTVISRLPAHNLFGQGTVNIQINRQDAEGHTKLSWKVSFNSDVGEAGQLAYRLETLIINRRLDDAGRPVPTMIRLGSLSDICQELGINPSGANSNSVKRALQQNAGALISANLSYKATDGGRHKLEATFTKYSVAFRGDELPNGEKSDGVIILLNEQYRRVLNRAGTRPLDFQYLKELTPSAQRFYEIISFQMYAALKHGYPEAKISYSDYCAYSGQPRQTSAIEMNKRMYKIHRPHLEKGYIAKVTYHPSRDLDGNPDWLMCYVPGPRAVHEYDRFNRKLYTEDRSDDLEVKHLTGDREPIPLALQLLQQFHLLARGVKKYQPRKHGQELQYVEEVIRKFGTEGAWYFVEFALVEAKKTGFKMANFGGAMQYFEQGQQSWQELQRQKEISIQQEMEDLLANEEVDALEQAALARIQSMSPEKYSEQLMEAKKATINKLPQAQYWEEDTLRETAESLLKSWVKEELWKEHITA